jgi:hypothetical protein
VQASAPCTGHARSPGCRTRAAGHRSRRWSACRPRTRPACECQRVSDPPTCGPLALPPSMYMAPSRIGAWCGTLIALDREDGCRGSEAGVGGVAAVVEEVLLAVGSAGRRCTPPRTRPGHSWYRARLASVFLISWPAAMTCAAVGGAVERTSSCPAGPRSSHVAHARYRRRRRRPVDAMPAMPPGLRGRPGRASSRRGHRHPRRRDGRQADGGPMVPNRRDRPAGK